MLSFVAVGTPETLLQCFEEAVTDDVVRVVVLKGARGPARTAALNELSRALAPRGVRVDVTDCDLHGGFAGGCLDSLLRARLELAVDASRGAVDEAVTRVRPEPGVPREFLWWGLGVRDGTLQISSLDGRSRDEGVAAEAGRLVLEVGPCAWVLDEAAAADVESVQLVEHLATRPGPGALVVLAVADEDAARVEGRLKALRLADRCRDLSLRGSVVRAEPVRLSAAAQTVVALAAHAGGAVPLEALAQACGAPVDDAVHELEQVGLARRGATRRFPAGELVVRPTATHGAPPALQPDVRARLWAWAEARLADADCRGLVVTLAGHESALASLGWELAVRASSTWREQVRAAPTPGRAATNLSDVAPRQLDALKRAEQSAVGVRRLVLARRLSEEELFRGEAARASSTAQAAMRGASASPVTVSAAWRTALLEHGSGDELDRWDLLTLDEALAALELARAEALCALGVARDTTAAFEAVRARLKRLPRTRARSSLWMRCARTLVWFRAEVLGDPAGARAACDEVKEHSLPEEREAGAWALGFLRAEEIAAARSGQTAQARGLADDLVRVSRQRGDLREHCVALNSRALMHLRDGELTAARGGFEASLDLSRSIGYRRREAVALHNLGLVQCLLGEYGASAVCQERYLVISESIGNQLARGYAPAALAMVQVQQGDLARAEANLNRARKAAEDTGWPAILAWTRHVSGLLRLARWHEKHDSLTLSLARTDLLACLDLLADRKSGWSEELDPAETAAALAVCWLINGNDAQAARALAEATRFERDSTVSARHVEALRAVCGQQRPVATLAWFEEQGHLRSLELWTRWLAVLGR